MSAEDGKPVPVDIEGDRWTWWYVCEECHGAVDWKDKTCPHCKSPLDWSDTLLWDNHST